MIEVGLAESLAWRLGQHALHTPAATGVVGAAERVVATRAWPQEVAELALAIRQADPQPGALARALETGELVQSYAFRGGAYVFTPDVAAVLLAVRTTSRVWESRRWQVQGGFEIGDWEPLREAVRGALAHGPATRAEIGEHLRESGLAHLAEAATTGRGADSLYKPLHWWGDIRFGPARDGQSTFRLLDGDPCWPGLPDVDGAGREAIRLYLAAYGPATFENLRYWLAEGLSAPKRRLEQWIQDLGEEITTVVCAGVAAYVLTSTLDELRDSEPSTAISLIPGYDPWVLGPGTADARVVAPRWRWLLTRGARPVLRGGVVAGHWRRRGPRVEVSWFAEAGAEPMADLEAAVRRLGAAHADTFSLDVVGSG
ncbi:DNA glycosylase AlkZ-like family protein [Pseudactinotalea sp.]|uniref:DNA glycosylase AlkZ-like family protein n=1 Tax=Pseudactinotalea sp. TaxID=1926260 RepID=UPI003B3B618F